MTILVYRELQNRRWWFRQIPGYKPSHQKFMEVLFFISLSTGYDEIIQETKLTKLMIMSRFSKWLKFVKNAKKSLKIVKIAQNLVFWPFFYLFWQPQFFHVMWYESGFSFWTIWYQFCYCRRKIDLTGAIFVKSMILHLNFHFFY